MVIAEKWPSCLISILALKLPLSGAYFPRKYHHHFKLPSNARFDQWKVEGQPIKGDNNFVISGSVAFIRRVCAYKHVNVSRVIVCFEQDFQKDGISGKFQWSEAKAMCDTLSLFPVTMRDMQFGGATNASFLFGFGNNLEYHNLPKPQPDIQRSLLHYLDGGVAGHFPSIPLSEVPIIMDPPRTPIKHKWGPLHEGCLRQEGLFNVQRPRSKILCPSYFNKNRLVIRQLSTGELLRLYQLPLAMDATLSPTIGAHDEVPFARAASCVIFTSVLRQLWGNSGGGLEEVKLVEGLERNEDAVEALKEEDDIIRGMTALQLETLRLEKTYANRSLSQDVGGIDHVTPPCSINNNKVEDSEASAVHTGSMSCSESGDSTDNQVWEFDFGEGWEPAFSEHSLLTDNSTLTSSFASEATLKTHNDSHCERLQRKLKTHNDSHCEGLQRKEVTKIDASDSKKRGPPKSNGGPPYSVGEEVLCEANGMHLQRAFVLEADHPRYRLRLQNGQEIDTAVTPAGLIPRYAPGYFAPDVEDPFKDLRLRQGIKNGSFGIRIDAQLDALRKVKQAKEFAKATKADDAEIPVYLWNMRVEGVDCEARRDKALVGLRKWGLHMFLRALRRDAGAYLSDTYGEEWWLKPRKEGNKPTPLSRDQHAIANMIWHATHSNWFEFKAGSRVVHLRFPLRYREIARDGVPVFFERPGPTNKDPQPPLRDPKVRSGVRRKLEKVLHRRYMLKSGLDIKSLIKYFAVPKGEDDIRIVYDATANKLNECVWVPSFWLPTLDTLLRALDHNSWMADRDIADMFLNFQLHAKVVPYTGVDLGPMYEKGDSIGDRRWACWDRNLMGFAASPYNSVKMALIAEEVCKGDRHQTKRGKDNKELNPFQWKSIRLNLPGTDGYDPTFSWVSKLRVDGRIACDLFTFVDDERLVGPTEELTWQAAHTLAAKQSYLGIQDAARKVRPCSQTPGAWSGSVVYVVKNLGVCVLTSEEKWDKLKGILKKWLTRLQAGDTNLLHKELLSDRGFLVYVTRNYPPLVPYLKGFNLTIEMWRGNRDAEGWKLNETDDSSLVSAHSLTSLDVTRAGAHGLNLAADSTYSPTTSEDVDEAAMDHRMETKLTTGSLYAPASGQTPAVPRFKKDLEALILLTRAVLPPLRIVRPSMVVQVFFGFGDAAGKGFGSTVAGTYNCADKFSELQTNDNGLKYRVGIWTALEELESSNQKEFCNLVETTEEECRSGRLQNCEFFLFTDNSTAESCFYRGSSKSPKLHNLVVRLRRLEMDYGMVIYLIHVSGKRMIAQGTDGCSRGFLMEGVMAGEDMLNFVDLGKDAIKRHPPLLQWIRSWTERDGLMPLSPEGWYEEGHGITGGEPDKRGVWIPTHGPSNKLFLWTPPLLLLLLLWNNC